MRSVRCSIGLAARYYLLRWMIPSLAKHRCPVFIIGFALVSGPFGEAFGAQLRAGLARTDITPSEPVMLAGYASRKDLSRGVHDPLSARVVAFEQEGQRLVLVSIDNVGFYNGTADPLRNAILESCSLKPSELFLCAIHTHSAPSLTFDGEKGHSNNIQYTRTLQGKLVEVVRNALDHMAPCQIGVGLGSSPVGANRREPVVDKTGKPAIVLGRNPSVMTDREVQVLKIVRSDEKKLAGAVFAYSTHSTSLGPKNYVISGDIHGLAAQFLETYFGNAVVAPEFAGASGNIDPWYRVLPEFKTNNGWIPEPVLLGTLLGEEVAQVTEAVGSFATNTVIKTALKMIELPAQSREEAQSAAAKVPMNVTVARVGDIAFVGWGGEVFNEIGKAIKTASPFRHTFILTHCNGAAGYLPTRPSYPEGGYEVQSSPFAPGADEGLIEETLKMLKHL